MSLNHSVIANLPAVDAVLNYWVPTSERPFRYTYEPEPGVPLTNTKYEARQLRVHDARNVAKRASLDGEGFALVEQETTVTDFYDEQQVRTVYYKEAERLLLESTGGTRAHIFDHTVRRRESGRPPLDSGRPSAEGFRGPVGRVHNDFTSLSGPARLRHELGDEAEALLKHRFAVINVWRSIRGPILDAPLAVCDARSVAPGDLVASDLIYRDRTGEIYQVKYNPLHRWLYVSQLGENEALLLKCYDSAEDGRARFAPHTAFEDPAAPHGAAPRESIELRAFVFFED